MEAMRVWYDQEGDYLEVVFEDILAYMEEVADDVFERRTTDGRIVGFAVFNFSKHDRGRLTVPLKVIAVPAT